MIGQCAYCGGNATPLAETLGINRIVKPNLVGYFRNVSAMVLPDDMYQSLVIG